MYIMAAAHSMLSIPITLDGKLIEFIGIVPLQPKTSKGFHIPLSALNFHGLNGHTPSKKLAVKRILLVGLVFKVTNMTNHSTS